MAKSFIFSSHNFNNPGKTTFFLLTIIVTVLFSSLLFLSCAPAEQNDKESSIEDNGDQDGKKGKASDDLEPKQEEEEKEGQEKEDKDKSYQEDYPEVLPDEIRDLPPHPEGQIMILMYHGIGESEGEWQRTPENFRRDLRTLYQEGYRLISMNDLLDGDIDVPPGTTPVVLTFDDGKEGQFRYLEDEKDEAGNPKMDPDCAVAIMEQFYDENPDFGLEASFYIFYDNPFRQQEWVEEKLNYLVDQGFEIGNHGYRHGNLGQLSQESKEAVEKELALHIESTQDYLPGYEIRTLALPYGAWPSPRELAIEGEYQGTSYQHDGVLLVGANPTPSPFHEDFDPYALPRVRASEKNTEGVGMYDWLEYFKENPEHRYIAE